MRQLVNKIVMGLLLSCFLNASEDVLLLDTSGSLSNPATVTEIKNLTQKYLSRGKSIIAFGDDTYAVHKVSDLHFGGGTATSKGLKAALDGNYKFIVLITDGDSDNDGETIVQANLLKAKHVKICSVFLSNSTSNIPITLSKISDKVFLSENISGAFEMCSDEVRHELLGKGAIKRIVDNSHFDLF